MSDIKKNFSLFLAFFAVIVSFLAYFSSDTGALPNKLEVLLNEGELNKITVSAEAERFVSPDVASFTFSFTRKSMSLKEATESVNKRASTLLRELERKGVDKDEIKTLSYNIDPEYSWKEREKKFVGYRVSQNFELKTKDLEKVSTLLDTVSAFGVDSVGSLTFSVENDEKIKEELRKEAIEKAKRKAKILSKDLGVKFGRIVAFSESRDYPYRPYGKDFFAEALSTSSYKVSVPTGKNSIKVGVSLTYGIE